MKKIMPLAASITLILIASVFASAGTMAWFSDTEQIGQNNFTAAYLDLELSPSASLPFAVADLVPGQSGSDYKTLTNRAGSIDGTLDVAITNFVQYENDLIEPELNPGYGTADYPNGPNAGELYIFLRMAMFIDVNKNQVFDTGDIQLAYNAQVLPYSTIDYLAWASPVNMVCTWDNIMTMTGGSSVDLVIMWQFPTESQDANYSQNIAMTDGLSFDIDVSLEQVGSP